MCLFDREKLILAHAAELGAGDVFVLFATCS